HRYPAFTFIVKNPPEFFQFFDNAVDPPAQLKESPLHLDDIHTPVARLVILYPFYLPGDLAEDLLSIVSEIMDQPKKIIHVNFLKPPVYHIQGGPFLAHHQYFFTGSDRIGDQVANELRFASSGRPLNHDRFGRLNSTDCVFLPGIRLKRHVKFLLSYFFLWRSRRSLFGVFRHFTVAHEKILQVRKVLRVHEVLVVGHQLRTRLGKNSQHSLREQFDLTGMMCLLKSCSIEFLKRYELIPEIIRIKIQFYLILKQLIQLRPP